MTSLYFRPWNRYPSLVVPCSATCLSIASLTYWDVPELAGLAELQRSQLGAWVNLLLYAQGLARVYPATEVDGERFADPQAAAVH